MRYWKDESSECVLCEPNCADEWMRQISEVGLDYDGESTVDGLKNLVDELIEFSQKARDCLCNGDLFPSKETKWYDISADGGQTWTQQMICEDEVGLYRARGWIAIETQGPPHLHAT